MAVQWEYRCEYFECSLALASTAETIDERIKEQRELRGQPELAYQRKKERELAEEAYLTQALNELGSQGWEAYEIIRSDIWHRSDMQRSLISWKVYLKRRKD